MGFKDIVVIFTDPAAAAARARLAAQLARHEEAHLVGLYLLPSITPFAGGVPYMGSATEVQALEEIQDEARRRALGAAATVEAAFTDATTRVGLSAEWRVVEGDIGPNAVLHALHLARHGVRAESSTAVSHDIHVGNAILSRAADFGSDLIVMGGYGHSRRRELVLGGATRTLLQHMTVPVLFSH